MNSNRIIDLDFGPDGALYVADYGGSNFAIVNAQQLGPAVRLHRRPGHPGSRPAGRRERRTRRSTTFAFNIGKSGGVSYKWDFSDGGTATGANVTHTYVTRGQRRQADGDADRDLRRRQTSSKTIDVPVADDGPGARSPLDVPKTLGLTFGSGRHVRRLRRRASANTYAASTTANVISTMPDAALSVVDQSAIEPGFLVNGTTPLASRLRVRATNAANPATPRSQTSRRPRSTCSSWAAPISNDAVTLQFQQPIGANEPLKAGAYTKTLTFTLSTTRRESWTGPRRPSAGPPRHAVR